MTNYNKILRYNIPQIVDEDIFKKSLKYILKFSSKPNKIFNCCNSFFSMLAYFEIHFSVFSVLSFF